MSKWEDYCITKLTFDTINRSNATEFLVHEDFVEHIGEGIIRTRPWLLNEARKGTTFCIADKVYGGWKRVGDFTYNYNDTFTYSKSFLPEVLPKRKTFLSFYHKDDEQYRERFEHLFNDLIINKCVEDGDFDSNNSDDYVKKLIQQNHLEDTTILIVLVGPNTKHRMHIDWEISGALNLKVGDRYSGLMGILLPSHSDYQKETYYASDLPVRLAENINSGYATLIDWTEKRAVLQKAIEDCYKRRVHSNKIVNNSIPQMSNNTN